MDIKKTAFALTHNKKYMSACIIILLIIIVGGIATWFYIQKTAVIFSINDQEVSDLIVEKEYGTEIIPDTEQFNLKAYNHSGEEITDRISFSQDTFKEVGEYVVNGEIENDLGQTKSFSIQLKIIDKQAPEFNGPNEIEWNLNEDFDYALGTHGISITDNHDENLIDNVTHEGEVNTAEAGIYEITYHIVDEAGNQASHNLKVTVKEGAVHASTTDDLYTDPRNITPNIVRNPENIKALVNKNNALPDGWAPNDLVAITSNNGRDMSLRKEAAASWERLNADAKAAGIVIQVVSSYRTQQYQNSLFYNYYAVDGSNAFLYSALSRRSEHEMGLAIDVSYDGSLHEDLLDSSVGKFMHEQGYKYGFILRYPSDKINITKYGFEAWHYRYVGIDLATKLKQNNMTLEEYYK